MIGVMERDASEEALPSVVNDILANSRPDEKVDKNVVNAVKEARQPGDTA